MRLKMGMKYRTVNGSIVEKARGDTVTAISGGHGDAASEDRGRCPGSYYFISEHSARFPTYTGGSQPGLDIIGPARVPNKDR